MILRRLAAALKRQDWATVLIEFSLVFAGVLVALQFDNWNSHRLDGLAERALLERLNVDVQAAQERLATFRIPREERGNNLETIVYAFARGDIPASLHNELCDSVVDSHIITFPPANVATLMEVMTGGQIALIKSQELRQSILDFERVNDRARTLFTALNVDRIELARLFPELISIDYVPNVENDGELEMISICDFEAMRQSRVFRNDFTSIYNRNEAYVRVVIGYLAVALNDLHKALQTELNQ